MTRLRPTSLSSLFLAGALALLGCRTSPEAGGDKGSPPTQRWDVHRDCTSGCDVDGLAYRQKLWPRATKVRRVDVSSKANYVWMNAGCTSVRDDYDGDQEFECME